MSRRVRWLPAVVAFVVTGVAAVITYSVVIVKLSCDFETCQRLRIHYDLARPDPQLGPVS